MASDATRDLLKDIRAFLAKRGIKGSYFGKIAANDPRLVARLEAGGDCRTATVEKVKKFIASQRSA